MFQITHHLVLISGQKVLLAKIIVKNIEDLTKLRLYFDYFLSTPFSQMAKFRPIWQHWQLNRHQAPSFLVH
jgi:hypothetical protein